MLQELQKTCRRAAKPQRAGTATFYIPAWKYLPPYRINFW